MITFHLSIALIDIQKFVVRRKVPMVFGSHERILAMDGDYIHVGAVPSLHMGDVLIKFRGGM